MILYCDLSWSALQFINDLKLQAFLLSSIINVLTRATFLALRTEQPLMPEVIYGRDFQVKLVEVCVRLRGPP